MTLTSNKMIVAHYICSCMIYDVRLLHAFSKNDGIIVKGFSVSLDHSSTPFQCSSPLFHSMDSRHAVYETGFWKPITYTQIIQLESLTFHLGDTKSHANKIHYCNNSAN